MADELKPEAGGDHYGKLQPWHLQGVMETSGDAFIDARRCDALKYAFRMKGAPPNRLHKLLDDLKKARHCLDAAITRLEKLIK